MVCIGCIIERNHEFWSELAKRKIDPTHVIRYLFLHHHCFSIHVFWSTTRIEWMKPWLICESLPRRSFHRNATLEWVVHYYRSSWTFLASSMLESTSGCEFKPFILPSNHINGRLKAIERRDLVYCTNLLNDSTSLSSVSEISYRDSEVVIVAECSCTYQHDPRSWLSWRRIWILIIVFGVKFSLSSRGHSPDRFLA